jgi:hypothetical protein
MTVQIADLVARVRAEGVEQTTAAVKSVGTSAEQSARALELMAQQFSKLHGGTTSDALTMFQRSGVQPTAAAMAQASAEMQKTVVAANQAVQPVRAIAQASAEHAAGWRLSESSVVRFGAAILGVNLGLSLVSGVAERVHSEILGSIEAARDLEVASRSAAANYGSDAARGISGSGAAFVSDPTTRGTQAEFIQSVAGMRSLTSAYGLNLGQVEQLVTASGQLARLQGVDLPTAAKALDAVMRGQTSAAEGLGITLTDQVGRLRGLGASYDELVEISGRTRAEQLLLSTTIQAVRAQQENARGVTDNLAAAYDKLGRNAETARQKMGQQLSGPAAGVVGAAADLLVPPGPSAEEIEQRRAGFIGVLPSGRGQLDSGDILSAEETQARLQNIRAQDAQLASAMLEQERAELVQATTATQQNTAAVQAQLSAYEGLRVSLNRTVESIGRIRQEQSQFSMIAEAARGPLFPQVLVSPQAVGAANAAQDVLALRAQREALGQGDRMRSQLQQSVVTAGEIGPSATARAQQALDQYDRRAAARTQQAQAQHDLALLDLNLADNQAGVTEISLRQRTRELALQQETIGLRRQDLQIQQATLAVTQDVTRARLAALPSEATMSAISFQSQMAQAIALQRQGRVIRGQDVSGLPSTNELVNSYVEAQFAEAENAPTALAAQRSVDVAQQRQTGAQLSEQLVSGQIRSAEIARDIANLEDLPEQTQLLIQQTQLQRDQLQAQREERDAVRRLIDITLEPPAGGAGVTQSVTINFTGPVSVRNDQDVADIANQAAELVVRGLHAGADSAPMANSGLVGARR